MGLRRLLLAGATILLVAATGHSTITYTYYASDGYSDVTQLASGAVDEAAGTHTAPHGFIRFRPERDRFVLTIDDAATGAGEPVFISIQQVDASGETVFSDRRCLLDGSPTEITGISATLTVYLHLYPLTWAAPTRIVQGRSTCTSDPATAGATVGTLVIQL